MAELLCPDMSTVGRALTSEEGLAVAADAERLQQLIGNKRDVLIVEEQ
jgi:hypothetical protein